jgi:hypothetical protein
MSDWKTLKQETIDIGGNNFIEINLKQPPKEEKLLLGISKGWYNKNNEKKYKTNILFSNDKTNEIIQAIKNISSKKE